MSVAAPFPHATRFAGLAWSRFSCIYFVSMTQKQNPVFSRVLFFLLADCRAFFSFFNISNISGMNQLTGFALHDIIK